MLQSIKMNWAETLNIRQDLALNYSSELLFQKEGICFLLLTNIGGEIAYIHLLLGIKNCTDHNGQMLCMVLCLHVSYDAPCVHLQTARTRIELSELFCTIQRLVSTLPCITWGRKVIYISKYSNIHDFQKQCKMSPF